MKDKIVESLCEYLLGLRTIGVLLKKLVIVSGEWKAISGTLSGQVFSTWVGTSFMTRTKYDDY